MAEALAQQVEAHKAPVEALKAGPDELNKYKADFIKTANSAKVELNSAEKKLKSNEAHTFLRTSVADIGVYLMQVAEHGRAILQKHEKKETIDASHYQPLDSLRSTLNNELGQLREGSGDYAKLEGAEKNIDKNSGEIDALLQSINIGNSESVLQKLNAIKSSLTAEKAGLPQSAITALLRAKIEGKIVDATDKIDKAAADIAAAMADKKKVDELAQKVAEYEKAAAAYEKTPSPELLGKVRALQTTIDPTKLSDAIFGNILGRVAPDSVRGKLYQSLWEGEYSITANRFNTITARIDEKEKEQYAPQAEKMLQDIDKNEKQLLLPKWQEYESFIREIKLDDKQKLTLANLEQSLLNGYLVLKATVAPFAGIAGKLPPEIVQKVQTKAEDISSKINQIEANRQVRQSREAIQKTGDLLKYVHFLPDERDGKVYIFTPDFILLPQEKQVEVRAAIETIISREKQDVKKKTYDSQLKLSTASGNFDQIERVLGDKSKEYISGLKQMTDGKFMEAIASFRAFIKTAKSLPDEERAKLQGAIDDATEKISLMEKSKDYLAGINKLKENDRDGAELLLRKYLEDTGKLAPEAQKIHAEQIAAAREILRMIGNEKIKLLQDLLSDVCTWKGLKINELRDKNKVKHGAVKVEGPEVGMIEGEIRALHERVNRGETVNFNEEFAKIKAKVKQFLDKQAINPEDNVIDKLSELYEALSGKDPATRKKALIAFAQECRDMKGYDIARKYLDKALEEEYKKESQNVSRDDVMRRMMADPKIMADIHAQAAAMYAAFKAENPERAQVVTEERAMQMIFERRLNEQYNRELRHRMTEAGMASGNDALAQYNEWSPYEQREHWYQFGKTYSAEDWDAWKAEAYEFTAMTIASLPLGMIGGVAAKGIGALTVRQAGGLLLRGSAEAGARDAAIAALEQGGLLALRPGSAAFRALEPAVQQFIVQNQGRMVLAGAAGLGTGIAVEGSALYAGNVLGEGLIAGRATEMSWSAVAETVIKAGVFRGVGFSGNRIFGGAMAAGGAKAAGAYLGTETFSGAMGTVVEAGSMYLSGHADQIDSAFLMQNLLQNAMQSGALHIGSGAMKLPKIGSERSAEKLRQRMDEAGRKLDDYRAYRAKQEADALPVFTPVDVDAPTTAKIQKRNKPFIDAEAPTAAHIPESNPAPAFEPMQPAKPVRIGIVKPSNEGGGYMPIATEAKPIIDHYRSSPDQLLTDFQAGKVPADTIVTGIIEGKIQGDKEFVNRLVETARRSDDCVVLLKLFLSGEQQARLIDKIADSTPLGGGASERLPGLIESGAIDITSSAVVEKLLTYGNGQTILANKLLDGFYKERSELAGKILESIRGDRGYILQIEKALMDGNIPPEYEPMIRRQVEANQDVDGYFGLLTESSQAIVQYAFEHARRNPDSPLGRLLAKLSGIDETGPAKVEEILAHVKELGPDYSYSDLLETIERVFRYEGSHYDAEPRLASEAMAAIGLLEQTVGPHMTREFERAFQGQESTLVPILESMRVRDPIGYEILRQNYQNLSPRYVAEIMAGKAKFVVDAASGQRVMFYENNEAGAGGFSVVRHIKYIDPDSGKLVDAVIKRPNDNTHEIFKIDEAGARRANEFNDPHINRLLYSNEAMMIMETGTNPRSFGDFAESAPLSQVIAMTRQVTAVLQTYRSKGYYHGDIKTGNILIVDGPDGPRVIVIDNNPRTAAEYNDQAAKGIVHGTPGYTPDAEVEASAKLMGVDRAVAYQGLDPYALGAIFGFKRTFLVAGGEREGILHKRARAELSPELVQRIDGLEKRLKDVSGSDTYDPNFYSRIDAEIATLARDIETYEQTTTEKRPNVQSVADNPTKPNISPS